MIETNEVTPEPNEDPAQNEAAASETSNQNNNPEVVNNNENTEAAKNQINNAQSAAPAPEEVSAAS